MSYLEKNNNPEDKSKDYARFIGIKNISRLNRCFTKRGKSEGEKTEPSHEPEDSKKKDRHLLLTHRKVHSQEK